MTFGRALKLTVLVLSLLLSPTLALAQNQEQSTAQQLLSQGIGLYKAGEYQQAKEVLQRIDALQLPKEDRVTLVETLQEIDRQSQLVTDPAGLLEEGNKADQQGKHDQAIHLYQQVLASDKATAEQKATATARQAEARRRSNAAVAKAKIDITQAEADVKAGRLEQANQRLGQVKASGLDLGWFDNERVTRLQAVIDERLQTQAAATTQPGEPAPAPAATDVLAQAKQLYAQEILAQARQAEQEGNYRLATQLYEKALKLEPTNLEIQTALTAAQAKGQQQELPRGVLETEVVTMQLRSAATAAEFNQLMNRARELKQAGNFTAALEAVQQAKITLDRNRRFLPNSQYQGLRDQAVALATEVSDASVQAQAAGQKEIESQRQREAVERRQQALQEQQAEIQRLLKRAVDLRREQKYDQSLELISQALFLDPNNIPAAALKEMIEDTRFYVKGRDLDRQKNVLRGEISVENQEAMLPYSELMTYPSDWPQLTALRFGSMQQSTPENELNRRIALKLKESVPINFENVKLINVIDFFRNITGLNFYVSWNRLSEDTGVQQDALVNLVLSNVPADHALKLVLAQVSPDDQNPISYSIINGIVTISTRSDLNRSTEFRTYDIRDLLVQVPNFENAPSFSLDSALSNTNTGGGGSGGGGGGSSGGSIFGESDAAAGGVGLDRTGMTDSIRTLIRDTVGQQSEWDTYGGTVSAISELNGNLIIRTTPSNHRDITSLLAQLRETRAMQISVEARFLLVGSNFLDEVGLDLDMQIDNVGGKFGPIRIAQDTFAMTARPATGLPGAFLLSGAGTIGAFVPDSGFPTSGRSLDIGASFLDDLQVNLIVRATQASRRSITLTAPRITFFNGQRAYVTVARQISFVSDLVPIPDAVGFDPTLSIVQSGVSLDVEGTISADRRYVTMTLRPNLASVIAPIRTIPITAAFGANDNNGGGGNNNNGGAVQVITGQLEAPELELTTLATTVSVPDRGTLLLGGQRLAAESEVEAGIPVLSKIPIINRLFTNRSSVKDERTLLVLVKPTIIIQSEQENKLFPGLLDAPTQYGAPGETAE